MKILTANQAKAYSNISRRQFNRTKMRNYLSHIFDDISSKAQTGSTFLHVSIDNDRDGAKRLTKLLRRIGYNIEENISTIKEQSVLRISW